MSQEVLGGFLDYDTIMSFCRGETLHLAMFNRAHANVGPKAPRGPMVTYLRTEAKGARAESVPTTPSQVHGSSSSLWRRRKNEGATRLLHPSN